MDKCTKCEITERTADLTGWRVTHTEYCGTHYECPSCATKYIRRSDCTCDTWGCDKCSTPAEQRRLQGQFS